MQSTTVFLFNSTYSASKIFIRTSTWMWWSWQSHHHSPMNACLTTTSVLPSIEWISLGYLIQGTESELLVSSWYKLEPMDGHSWDPESLNLVCGIPSRIWEGMAVTSFKLASAGRSDRRKRINGSYSRQMISHAVTAHWTIFTERTGGHWQRWCLTYSLPWKGVRRIGWRQQESRGSEGRKHLYTLIWNSHQWIT